jgi:nitrous oxide reductase
MARSLKELAGVHMKDMTQAEQDAVVKDAIARIAAELAERGLLVENVTITGQHPRATDDEDPTTIRQVDISD